MNPELFERLYHPDVATFEAAVSARTPIGEHDETLAAARRWHALRTAAVTAAYEPYRLGKGKQGGGRFAKRGDIGIDILRKLLAGDGKARSDLHASFGKSHRDPKKGFGRGPSTPANLTKWATQHFGPRPRKSQDGLAWDAGKRELGVWHAQLPEASRAPLPDATPDGMVDWGAAKVPRHSLPTVSPDVPDAPTTQGTRPASVPDVGDGDLVDWGAAKQAKHGLSTGPEPLGHKITVSKPDEPLREVVVPAKIRDAVTGGDGTVNSPYVTDDVDAAVFMLTHDQHVQLGHTRQVSTMLDRLQAEVKRMQAVGAEAPVFDLCKVTVPGTNLFCVENVGKARIDMPQLGGVPTPGSPADSLPKSKNGAVDLSAEFIAHLRSKGIDVRENDTAPADVLKASQKELNGGKIVGMMSAIDAGTLPPGAIFVSRDDYVIDGHHRWAANVGAGYKAGETLDMPVHVIDMDVIDVLAEANQFAKDMGIPQASAATMVTGGDMPSTQDSPVPRFAGLDDIPADLLDKIAGGTGTKDNPFHTADPTTAAHLLSHDQHTVLDSTPDQISVVLDEVRKMKGEIDAALKEDRSVRFDDMLDLPKGTLVRANGKTVRVSDRKLFDASTGKEIDVAALAGADGAMPDTVERQMPNFDLCKLTVPGTNLFCVESKGIKRINMPQLSGKPTAGSPGDSRPKDSDGKIDLTSEFPAWLAERGIAVTPGRRRTVEMKPTQHELDGGKTSGIMMGWRDVRDRGITRADDVVDPDTGETSPQFRTADGEMITGKDAEQLAGLTAPLFVDRDGYIVDGHHRWSGAMGADIESDGDGDIEIDTLEIDENTDIISIIALANQFTAEMGIPPADATAPPSTLPDAPTTQGMAARPDIPPTATVHDDGTVWDTVDNFGMKYDPANESNPDLIAGRAHESVWASAPVTKIKVDGTGPVLNANEAEVKLSTIERVKKEGKVREGYVTKLLIDRNGDYHIVDGHHRVAINRALGQDMDVQIVDLRERPDAFDGPPDDVIKAADIELSDATSRADLVARHGEEYVAKAEQSARELLDKIVVLDAPVTQDLTSIAEATGMEMVSLDTRLKTQSSLTRKIADKSKLKGLETDEYAAQIADALRFTASSPADSHAGAVQSFVQALRDRGYRIDDAEIENYWTEVDDYNGINATFHVTGPDGEDVPVEIQFHTPETLKAKDEAHPWYEIGRATTDPAVRSQAYEQSMRIFEAVPRPDGIEQIGVPSSHQAPFVPDGVSTQGLVEPPDMSPDPAGLRKPIAERSISQLLYEGSSPEDIRRVLKQEGLSELQRDALRNLLAAIDPGTAAVAAAMAVVAAVKERRAQADRDAALHLARRVTETHSGQVH